MYRLQYVDRSRTGKGRATFKHIERDLFLYYIKDSQVTGWIIGPKPGISIGGLFINVSNVQFCIAGVLAALRTHFAHFALVSLDIIVFLQGDPFKFTHS